MAYSLKTYPLWARYAIGITEILLSLSATLGEKGKCFRSARLSALLFKCTGRDSLPGGTLSPRDKSDRDPTGEIRVTGIPQAAKPGGPGRFWLKATYSFALSHLAGLLKHNRGSQPSEGVFYALDAWARRHRSWISSVIITVTLGKSRTLSTPSEMRKNWICLPKASWR